MDTDIIQSMDIPEENCSHVDTADNFLMSLAKTCRQDTMENAGRVHRAARVYQVLGSMDEQPHVEAEMPRPPNHITNQCDAWSLCLIHAGLECHGVACLVSLLSCHETCHIIS